MRLLTPCLAVDPEGLWPVFGGRVQDGLEWKRLAAVGFADGGQVELFPVDLTLPVVRAEVAAPAGRPMTDHRLRAVATAAGTTTSARMPPPRVRSG